MESYMNDVIKLVDLSQNKPLNQIIYEGLRTAIISGIIPIGERINEKHYAECLNVSRTPIREALRRIQEEEIVEYIPNYGIVVRRINLEDVHEIYQLRVALDILASVNAMKLMSEEDFRVMEDLLDRTDALHAQNDVQGVIDLSREFNNLIYRFARMPRLEIIQNRLRDYVCRFRDISLKADDRRGLAVNEHRLIYRCLLNKETEQLELVIREHLTLSKSFILHEVEKETNSGL